jgi:broad specificity phosphatase PhoE
VTTVLLIRHAVHSLLDRVLVGRTAGVRLSESGRRQAAALAAHLAREPLAAVCSSPQPRARETARPIAIIAGVRLEIAAAIDEIDLGAWTGRSFAELDRDPDWRAWNSMRCAARPPGGESMRELQRRVVDHLQRVHAAYPNGRIALVSHAEVIRAALLYYLRLSLDAFAQIEIRPASIATLMLGEGEARVVALNQTVSA